jgi:putative flippase GtrA
LAFIRYTLTGGIATAVHYGVLIALVEGLHLKPSMSAVIGALCGAFVAYLGNHKYTFSSRSSHRVALPRFMIIAAIGAALNGAIVWTGTTLLNWHYLIAQLLATLFVLFLTYQLNRSWTFQ